MIANTDEVTGLIGIVERLGKRLFEGVQEARRLAQDKTTDQGGD